MSTAKQYAVKLIEAMPEEKVVAFIQLLADENELARMETEALITDTNRKTYNNFGEFRAEIEGEMANEI